VIEGFSVNDSRRSAGEHYVELVGRVVELRTAACFIVELDGGHRVPAHVSGRLVHHGIRVGLDDRVTVGLLSYDPSRGRIVSRA